MPLGLVRLGYGDCLSGPPLGLAMKVLTHESENFTFQSCSERVCIMLLVCFRNWTSQEWWAPYDTSESTWFKLSRSTVLSTACWFITWRTLDSFKFFAPSFEWIAFTSAFEATILATHSVFRVYEIIKFLIVVLMTELPVYHIMSNIYPKYLYQTYLSLIIVRSGCYFDNKVGKPTCQFVLKVRC